MRGPARALTRLWSCHWASWSKGKISQRQNRYEQVVLRYLNFFHLQKIWHLDFARFSICAWQLRCTYCRHAHQQHKWAEIRSKIGHYVYRSAEDEPWMQVSIPSKVFEWLSEGWAAAISILSPTNLLRLVCPVFDYAVSAVCQGFGLGNGGASRGWTSRMLDGFMVSPNFKLQTHLAAADLWCPCFRDSISFAGARSNQLVLDKGRELRVYSGHHCFEASSFGTEFVVFWLLNLTTCSGRFSCCCRVSVSSTLDLNAFETSLVWPSNTSQYSI